MTFDDFFTTATGLRAPFDYQRRLATEPWPDVVDVPTGLGKTAAAVLAWAYKRRVVGDAGTPRRLVYCLPMRVLVEQTEAETKRWLEKLQLYTADPGAGGVSVHVLMGGAEDVREATWADYPEADTVLIGTQDMLLSRALMRGYGMSRYQWPVHFAWLHHDALWVFDEVQLMGPGLTTAAQLEGLRRGLAPARPARSLWMSATLNRAWLNVVDFRPHVDNLTAVGLEEGDRANPDVAARVNSVKSVQPSAVSLRAGNAKQKAAAYIAALAGEVRAAHRGETTLVIMNTVERAQALYRALAGAEPPVLLLHARFRPKERRDIEAAIRQTPGAAGRIVIATQALEAGVDITSRALFTELAPWASLVQRFGRCNRYGEENEHGGGHIAWIDIADEALAAPYEGDELAAARRNLEGLTSASPGSLPPTDGAAPRSLVLRRKDLLDLFDTDADLSGFDIDVSPYIRDTGTPQLQVFWREIDGDPNVPVPQPPAAREELCPVSIGQAKALDKRDKWIWDPLQRRPAAKLDGGWVRLSGDPRPGMTLLLDAAQGGYDAQQGFTLEGKAGKQRVDVLPHGDAPSTDAFGDDAESRRRIAIGLPRHLTDVAGEAAELCRRLGEDAGQAAVVRAARWHDVGKIHKVFQATMHACPEAPPEAVKLAKSPCRARHGLRYFRHELASVLAWLAHGEPGLEHDLIGYLIVAHHGKLRMSMRAMPGERPPGEGKRFARGVHEGDVLEPLVFDGESIPETTLSLAVMELGEGSHGQSWSERTQRLLDELGPFRLAWLEALVRVADWRASRKEQSDANGGEERP